MRRLLLDVASSLWCGLTVAVVVVVVVLGERGTKSSCEESGMACFALVVAFGFVFGHQVYRGSSSERMGRDRFTVRSIAYAFL